MPTTRPILHLLPSEPFGGLQSIVIDLAQAQQAAGKVVKILLLGDSPRVVARCRAAGIEPIVLAGGKLARMVALRRRLSEFRDAIVHSHCEPIWAVPILAARPSSWVVHLHVYANRAARYWSGHAIRRHFARRFIAITHSIGESFSDNNLVPTRRLGMVYNGLDFANFPEPATTRNDLFTVAFVGRAVREKGLFDFIEVADLLRDVPDLRFVIAGEGGGLSDARRLITQKGLDDRITVLGFVEDMQDVWRSSDLLLMLSELEPFGLVTIEAIASGVAVLGYDTQSGGSEVMANLPGCDMVKPFDIAALAQGILKAVADKDLRRVVQFGRVIAMRRFSMTRMEEEVAAEYELAGLKTTNSGVRNSPESIAKLS